MLQGVFAKVYIRIYIYFSLICFSLCGTLQEEERRVSSVGKELNHLQSLILRSANQAMELENEMKILEAQSRNEKKKIDSLAASQVKSEKQLQERKDILYTLEFEAQKSAIRFDRLTGSNMNKEEEEQKKRRIEALQKTVNEKLEIRKLLKIQIAALMVSF